MNLEDAVRGAHREWLRSGHPAKARDLRRAYELGGVIPWRLLGASYIEHPRIEPGPVSAPRDNASHRRWVKFVTEWTDMDPHVAAAIPTSQLIDYARAQGLLTLRDRLSE